MNKCIGVKLIEAEEMNLGDYNIFRGWTIPDNEDPKKEGYLVKYPDGYVSWSPKEIFEEAYRKTSSMTFGLAVEAMKKGLKVCRPGWNGGGMCLQAQFPDEHSKMTFPYLYMTIPDCTEGTRRLPWQPAQVDIFSEDWQIVE